MDRKALGKIIANKFNFIYETSNGYYVLGRDFNRQCTDLEIEVYKEYKEAVDSGDIEEIKRTYLRVRKYTGDVKASSRERQEDIVEFVIGLSNDDFAKLVYQHKLIEEYTKMVYER